MTSCEPITVTLSPDLDVFVRAVAARAGVKPADVITEAVRDGHNHYWHKVFPSAAAAASRETSVPAD